MGSIGIGELLVIGVICAFAVFGMSALGILAIRLARGTGTKK